MEKVSDPVPDHLVSAVISAVITLIIKPPVIRQIFDFVIACRYEVAVLLRRIFNEDLSYAARFVEVALEPVEDAGSFDFFLVRQKLVQVVTREPCSVGGIDLLNKLRCRVCKTLQRRTAACRTHQHRGASASEQRPQVAHL